MANCVCSFSFENYIFPFITQYHCLTFSSISILTFTWSSTLFLPSVYMLCFSFIKLVFFSSLPALECPCKVFTHTPPSWLPPVSLMVKELIRLLSHTLSLSVCPWVETPLFFTDHSFIFRNTTQKSLLKVTLALQHACVWERDTIKNLADRL